MDILQMSITAAILIFATVVIRQFALNKLPKKTFMILWSVILLQLLIPFTVTVTLPEPAVPAAVSPAVGVSQGEATIFQPIPPPAPPRTDIFTVIETVNEAIPSVNTSLVIPVTAIWIIGIIALALYFLVSHIKGRKWYNESIPINNDYIQMWLSEQKMTRTIQVRQSDRIESPLTYGVVKPIILLPKNINLQDFKGLTNVLTHELIHIRRFDVLTKWLLAAALCVHWFNPLVWVMYVLANRDIEFSCDEAVIKTLGARAKSSYAMTLIEMEEKRSEFSPAYTFFSKNPIEERINAIMKLKNITIFGVVVSLLLISTSVSVFALTSTGLIGGNGNSTVQSRSGNFVPPSFTLVDESLTNPSGLIDANIPDGFVAPISREAAADIAAEYIWDMLGVSIEGMYVETGLVSWPVHTAYYWVVMAGSQLHIRTCFITGEDSGFVAGEDYTYMVKIDTHTGQRVSIRQLQNRPEAPEVFSREEFQSQIDAFWAFQTLSPDEQLAYFGITPEMFNAYRQIAMEFADRHSDSALVDVQFGNTVGVIYMITEFTIDENREAGLVLQGFTFMATYEDGTVADLEIATSERHSRTIISIDISANNICPELVAATDHIARGDGEW